MHLYDISTVLCILTCACALWLGFTWRWRRAHNMLGHLPHYPTLPLIGNLHYLKGDGENAHHIINEVSKIMDEKMKPFIFWAGPLPFLFVSDPLDVKIVTNAYIEKPYMYQFTENWLGDGLITAAGSIWKHTSKKLPSSFSLVDSFQEVFNLEAKNMVDLIKKEEGNEPFDILHKYMHMMTLKTICKIAIGESGDSSINEYFSQVNRILNLHIRRCLNIFVHPKCLYHLTTASKEFRKCAEYLNNVAQKVIDKQKIKRKQIKNTKLHGNKRENEPSTATTYLDLLLDLGESDPLIFTAKQIRCELNTIIIAGYETLSFTLNMCLLMIGSNPHVQDKLYAELRNIFGDSKRPVTKTDLTEMRYCEAVIKESLRLYPAVPVAVRHADRDNELQSCTIPKDTFCCLNFWGAGRSKRSWGEDAEVFRPERWFENAENSGFCMPFSYGKRSCIGKRYATALMKTVIAHCVRDLVLVADTTGLRLSCKFTYEPLAGHFIQVKTRQPF